VFGFLDGGSDEAGEGGDETLVEGVVVDLVPELSWEEEERRGLLVERSAGFGQFLKLESSSEYLHGVAMFLVLDRGVRTTDDSLLARGI
jgi:hypothetical protein